MSMITTDAVGERLTALHAEYERGARYLADLDAQRAELRDRLLRIAGAIDALEGLTAPGE